MPFHGLRLDLSGFAYVSAIAFILSVPSFFMTNEKWLAVLNKIIRIYFWIILIFIINIHEVEFFHHTPSSSYLRQYSS